ncbi:MAG: FHA domain-containing protein [Planctomycetota bacterium]
MSRTSVDQFRFRIQSGSSARLHELDNGRSVFMGSGDSCGIQLKGADVAEIHCLIDIDEDGVSVQDWASDSGTLVNGRAIEDKTRLQPGDTIRLGTIEAVLEGSVSEKPVEEELPSEPRQASIGMEALGRDEDIVREEEPQESTCQAAETPIVNAPVVNVPTGRLSDSFGSVAPDSPPDSAPTESLQAGSDDPIHLREEFNPFTSEVSDAPEPDASTNEIAPEAEIRPDEDIGGDDPWDTDFSSNQLTAEDLDWDPSTIEDEDVDPEIVQLLKAEIEDLRIQLAERDEQLAALEGLESAPMPEDSPGTSEEAGFGSQELVQRVEDLLAELAEHDERVATMQEMLQAAEMQNEAQTEERNCLETWLSEIEQRIGERESEWQAEQDALRDRLEQVSEERDRAQQHLHAATQRYGEVDASEVVPDETLQRLQKMNGELQAELERVHKENAGLTRQMSRLENEEPEELQGLRAELAQEKASVSRMRFQLSKQLQDIDTIPAPKDQPDKEFAYKLQTLREHLREIHEEEREEREKKGDSLFGRISSLWKRVDEEY